MFTRTAAMTVTLALPLGLSLCADAGKAAKEAIVAGEPQPEAERISYHLGQTPVVPVQLKWRTILILPSSEKILDVSCGFKDDWDVYAPPNSNFAMVQPLKAGARTDLAVVSKSGNIYTFALQDISTDAAAHAFTQVMVELADDKMRQAVSADPKYYNADDVAAFQAQARKAEEKSQEEQAKAAKQREDARALARVEAEKQIKHDYHYDQAAASKAPFHVNAVWHDEKFTHIEANPSEQFAVYEVVDGKPTAINIFPSGDGSYRTDRVIDSGYLKLGKKQLHFSR